MKRILLAAATVFSGLSFTARAQTFDREHYTYSNLTATWNQAVPALSQTQTPYVFFLKVEAHGSGAEVPETYCSSDDPFEASLCEASQPENAIKANAPGSNPKNLGVFPLFAGEAASFYPRLINLQRYYNRHTEYETYHADRLTTAQMNELERRKNKTLSELFLLHLRLYYAEANLATKCMRMKRAQGYLNQLGDHSQASFASFQLDPHTLDAISRLPGSVFQEVKNPSVCRLVAIKNQAAERDDMVALTIGKLKDAISAKLELTLQGISSASQEITNLANRLQGKNGQGIPLVTDKIFNLERDVNNAAGNLRLVAGDLYKVEGVANANKLTPTDPAGTRIPDDVNKAITNGPSLMQKAKGDVYSLFEAYIGKLENFVSFIAATHKDRCSQPGQTCPQRCASMERYARGDSRLSLQLRPLDPLAVTAPTLTNPKEYLIKFRSELEGCLSDLSQMTQSTQALSPAEQYQLLYSNEMNRFHPAVLR